MKIINLIRENKHVSKLAMEKSLDVKMATDSPGAFGSMIEMQTEKLLNKALSETNKVLLTNKGIKRCIKRGHLFDFSIVGAKIMRNLKTPWFRPAQLLLPQIYIYLK